MASLTGVGDTVTLSPSFKGETVDIAISGTYNMVLYFQREVGAPGSGAWETLKSYSTADATVAETYVTEHKKENLRIIVETDTSGTAVATLTDNFTKDFGYLDIKDENGNSVINFDEGNAVFGVGVQKEVVNITASTLVMTREAHGGRILLLNASGGIDIDLPAATGSGAVYEFYVGTATTDAYELSAFDTDAAAIIQGVVCGADDAAEFIWAAGAANNTVTLGGTAQATGGTVGDHIRLVDIAAGVYACSGFIHQGGTEATPFSTDS